MRKKILVAGSSMRDKGGIVTVMENIDKSFIANKYHMERVETYITGSISRRILMYLKGLLLFLYKVLIKRPDLIHIHMSYKGSFYRKSLLIMIAKSLKIPVFVHIHGSSFKDFYNALNSITKKFCHYILNNADQIIVLSKEWKIFFSAFVDSEKVFVLYNGVQISNNKKSLIEQTETPVCLFLGRLGKRKGIYDLLDSIKELKEKNAQVKFILAGDGEIEKVNAIISEYQIENMVETVGWINGTEKENLMKSADVLVLPSYNEGLPMAILEAMDQGLAIVSTTVGGIPEIIKENENGFLIEPGDTESLTQSLYTILENSKLRKEMAIKNQVKVKEQFDLNILLQDLDRLYLRFINKKEKVGEK